MLKKLKNKKVIIVSIMIMLTSVLMLSYASFVVTTNDYKASELLVSELTYSLTIYDENNNQIDNPIRVSANTTKIYNVVIRSINKIDSKYTLAYNSLDDVTVKYSNRTSWSTEDYIKDYNSNNTKKVRIVVENKSNEERQVEIKIFGGYRYNKYSDINIGDYTRITEEYNEMLASTSETLEEIIKEETKCNKDNCLYGGGSKSNYLSYSNNLYRIIGTYTIGTDKVTKIISENITTSSNIKEDLTSIYNNLEKKDEIIYKTNKFNCNESTCNETDYNNIGLLTKYEYETIGGENSYLNSDEGYYVLNGTNIEIQNGSETGGLKPVIYLPSTTKVTGSGTLNDPYRIKIKTNKDINIAFTLNGVEQDASNYDTVKRTKAVGSIECENGSVPTWDYSTTSLNLSNINLPESCTVHFIDGYKVTMKVINGTVTSSNPQEIIPGGSTTFTTKGTNTQKVDSVSCDGGADVTQSNGVVTVSNINAPQTCTIKYKYTVTMIAQNGGKVTSASSVDTINNAIFTVSPNGTSPVASHTLTCTNGAKGTLSGSTVTVTNITKDATTCTIGYRYTVTMNSSRCPAIVNNNTGACYVIKHITNGDDKTAKIGTVTYKDCTINSYTMKYGYECNTSYTDINTLGWYYYKDDDDGSETYGWFRGGNYVHAQRTSCSVVLNCTI